MIRDYNDRKSKQTLNVVDSRFLAEGVYRLTLEYPPQAAPSCVKPGQFVGVFTGDSSALLMRPISICEWNAQTRQLRLVYRVVGKGTGCFARLQAGEKVDVLGILGNGYDVPALRGRRVLILGGGIGAPPMLGLAQALQKANAAGEMRISSVDPGGPGEADSLRNACDGSAAIRDGSLITSVMGYRTRDLFLTEEFMAVGRLVVATDDGTAGFHGNAVDAARDLIRKETQTERASVLSERRRDRFRNSNSLFDVICACGPLPMLRAVKQLSQELGIPAYISLEERMACGVGACLGCVTRTASVDGHSHVRNARVCTEGPVFNAEDVEI